VGGQEPLRLAGLGLDGPGDEAQQTIHGDAPAVEQEREGLGAQARAAHGEGEARVGLAPGQGREQAVKGVSAALKGREQANRRVGVGGEVQPGDLQRPLFRGQAGQRRELVVPFGRGRGHAELVPADAQPVGPGQGGVMAHGLVGQG
jgi:hypothetical protein